jgi:peptidyl-prolyl cis-trans isomerase C
VLARGTQHLPSARWGSGWSLGQMVRAIISGQSRCAVHGPVKSQFGYHLVQVFYRE